MEFEKYNRRMGAKSDKDLKRTMSAKKRRTCCFLVIICIFGGIGVGLLITGIVLIPVLNDDYYDTVQETALLKPDADRLSSKFFKKIPMPLRVKFSLFQVENPIEIVERGEKPVLLEKGPYVYSEERTKEDITYFRDGKLCSYHERRVFHFLRNESAGNENDYVRLLNVPFLNVLNNAKNESFLKRIFLSAFIKSTNASLFENKTVKEWIWGYNDPLLMEINSTEPGKVPFTFFGWYMDKNDTLHRNVTVSTGLGNHDDEGHIISWNGAKRMSVWNGASCNAINGSDGTFFHADIQRSAPLYAFAIDICRSFKFSFSKEGTVKRLPFYEFHVAKEALEEASVNPDNACFCTPDTSHCFGMAMLNISKCQYGAPVISSQPHFYRADPRELNRLVGLHPDSKLHGTYMRVEPRSGVVMEGAKRIQFNGFVENWPVWKEYFGEFPNASIFPVLWVEESAALDDHTADLLYDQLDVTFHEILAVQVSLIVIGGVIVIVCIVLAGLRMIPHPNKDVEPENYASNEKSDAGPVDKTVNAGAPDDDDFDAMDNNATDTDAIDNNAVDDDATDNNAMNNNAINNNAMNNNAMDNDARDNDARDNDAMNNNTRDNNARDNNAMNNAMKNDAMDNNTMDNNAMDNDAMDNNAMDSNAMNNAMDNSAMDEYRQSTSSEDVINT